MGFAKKKSHPVHRMFDNSFVAPWSPAYLESGVLAPFCLACLEFRLVGNADRASAQVQIKHKRHHVKQMCFRDDMNSNLKKLGELYNSIKKFSI